MKLYYLEHISKNTGYHYDFLIIGNNSFGYIQLLNGSNDYYETIKELIEDNVLYGRYLLTEIGDFD